MGKTVLNLGRTSFKWSIFTLCSIYISSYMFGNFVTQDFNEDYSKSNLKLSFKLEKISHQKSQIVKKKEIKNNQSELLDKLLLTNKDENKEDYPNENSLSKNLVISKNINYEYQCSPVYPKRSIELNQEGEVILKAKVLSDGKLSNVQIYKSSGYILLDQSALAAVNQWKVAVEEREQLSQFYVWVPINFVIK